MSATRKPLRLRTLRLLSLYAGLWFALLLLILDAAIPLKLPDPQRSFSQLVLAENGRTLRAFADQQGIWRQSVSLEQVSPNYIDALLAYEDRGFWYHPGVNPYSLARAAWLNWQCDCIVSGGSTLTMQVARILHPHRKTIAGKLMQIARALQLEWHLSKREILELYLNYAPFGGTIEGIEAASQAYLEKSSQQLTHAEAALMAVLPQRPSRLRPDRHPLRAQQARDKVLKRMQALGVWDPALVSSALLEQVVATQPQRPNYAPLLARSLRQQYPQQAQIKTHIDFDMQQGIENQIENWIKSQPDKSSAAILVVENKTAKVRAYIGSANFQDADRFGHVDMVRAIRSPGSTLKPFIYGIAIDQGLIHSKSLLSDSPRFYSQYKPQNFARGFSGPVSVEDALQRSLNLPAVQVLEQLGPAYFYSRLKAAGLNLKLPDNARPNLSIALGGTGVSLWQLVAAYATLANQGQWLEPIVLQDKAKPSARYLMDESAAWIVYKMLSSHLRPGAVRSENILRSEASIAWKTGTSFGYRDAWAIGSSEKYTIGIWLGRPDGTPMTGHFGALNAAPLLFNISDALHQHQVTQIERPKSVSSAAICWPLGQLASVTPETMCHQQHKAWLAKRLVPKTFNEHNESSWLHNPLTFWTHKPSGLRVNIDCNKQPMKKHRVALWPKELEHWLAHKYTRGAQIPQPDKSCDNIPELKTGALRIVGIEDKAIFTSAGNSHQPQELPTVALNSIGGLGPRQWYNNGRYLFTAENRSPLNYTFKHRGEQQIMVIDEQGNSDHIDIYVH